VALAGGCATSPAIAPNAEDVVRDRAQQRWAALIEGNWERAYNLMSPGYRAVVPLKRFSSQFGGGVAWQRAEVVGVKCETERCGVQLKVEARVAMGARRAESIATGVDEVWVLEDGQWWKFEKI